MESTHTFLENNDGFAILQNCNVENRWKCWNDVLKTGHLPHSENQGCGINALVFLSEMTIPDGTSQVKRLVETNNGIGTPMEDIVRWLNMKNKTTKTANNYYLLDTQLFAYISKIQNDYILSESVDKIKNNIYKLYKQIYDSLPIDSCIIVKFNRNMDELNHNNVRLTPGHTMVLSKYVLNGEVVLSSIDPQQKQGPRILKIDEWEKNGNKVSQGTYNSLVITNHYRSMSIIMVRNIINNHNSLKDLCIKLNEKPTNLQLDKIINMATLIKNNNVSIGGKKIGGDHSVDISKSINEYVSLLSTSNTSNKLNDSVIPKVKKTNKINNGNKLNNKKYKKTTKNKYKKTLTKSIKKK